MYYIGLDVHKKAISYCVKDDSGRIYAEGSVPATRLTLVETAMPGDRAQSKNARLPIRLNSSLTQKLSSPE